MIQTDLEDLKKIWYDLGFNGKNPFGSSPEQKELFKSLDNWQRKELIIPYGKGQADSFKSL